MNKTLLWVVVIGIIVIAGGVAYATYGHSEESTEMMAHTATSSDAMMQDDHMGTSTDMMGTSSDMMHEATGTMMH